MMITGNESSWRSIGRFLMTQLFAFGRALTLSLTALIISKKTLDIS
jgi:hypothetical protein